MGFVLMLLDNPVSIKFVIGASFKYNLLILLLCSMRGIVTGFFS